MAGSYETECKLELPLNISIVFNFSPHNSGINSYWFSAPNESVSSWHPFTTSTMPGTPSKRKLNIQYYCIMMEH